MFCKATYTVCVHMDMDWQEDGFVFQYSEDLAEEAEITINTLLPLLKHYFPNADAGCNFTSDAEERCRTMVWDDVNKRIIDTTNNETAQIMDEEELVGFVFEAEAMESLNTMGRPSHFMPGDNDSVSTFRSLQSRQTNQQQPAPQLPTSQVSSTSTLVSSISPPTNTNQSESPSLDLKLTQLTTQLSQQQQQFNDLQSMFTQFLTSQQNSSSSGNSNNTAGGVNAPSGEEL